MLQVLIQPGRTLNLGPTGLLQLLNPTTEPGRAEVSIGDLAIPVELPPHGTRVFHPNGQDAIVRNEGPGPLIAEISQPIEHLPTHG